MLHPDYDPRTLLVNKIKHLYPAYKNYHLMIVKLISGMQLASLS